jgi:hypothetical protein
MVNDKPGTQGFDALGFNPRDFLVRDWPYIAMLVSAVVGVALASVALDPMTEYWAILVPLFAGVCVWTRLRDSQQQKLGGRLIRIEALHWGAVIVAMHLIFLPDISQMMNADVAALMALTILALWTFTAGAQIGAWRVCVVGAVLGLGVPLIAWLDRPTLLVTLTAIVLVTFAAFLFAHHRRHCRFRRIRPSITGQCRPGGEAR